MIEEINNKPDIFDDMAAELGRNHLHKEL